MATVEIPREEYEELKRKAKLLEQYQDDSLLSPEEKILLEESYAHQAAGTLLNAAELRKKLGL